MRKENEPAGAFRLDIPRVFALPFYYLLFFSFLAGTQGNS